jgi:hypothetical protein
MIPDIRARLTQLAGAAQALDDLLATAADLPPLHESRLLARVTDMAAGLGELISQTKVLLPEEIEPPRFRYGSRRPPR